MWVIPDKRAIVLKLRDPARVTAVIPTARTVQHNGVTLVAVPHRYDETRVLRNIGIDAPAPISTYYRWSGSYTPFAVQRTTAEMLSMHRRGFVLNGLGSGKTLSVLWAYDWLRLTHKVKRLLVVCPLSTLERTWADELFRHFPHLSFAVLHGTADKRRKLLAQDADVYLINHDGVQILTAELAERPDIDLIVVDEIAQAARNAQTDRWRALHSVINKQCDGVRWAWGLTGTPTPNAPTDAWAQCRLMRPESVPPYFNRFRDSVMRQAGPYKWLARDGATAVVMEAMQPSVCFRREECVDLPACMVVSRHAALTPEQEAAYATMVTTMAAECADGKIIAVNEAVKLAKLVQIACGVAYSATGDEVCIPASGRLAVVQEIIEEAASKVIVFVPFVSGVGHVAGFVRSLGKRVGVIHGGVSKNERDEIFSGFQKGDDYDVLVAQPAAMAHGLTLTAANTIVWYAPVTSNDIYEQASGRITRPGQKLETYIINIEGTPVERKLYARLADKQSMQGALLDLLAEQA